LDRCVAFSFSDCVLFISFAKSLPESDEECASKADELLRLVDESTQQHLHDSGTRSVCQRVSTSQQLTQHRVVPFLDEILDELSSFEVG
jgi:hypothetical protein